MNIFVFFVFFFEDKLKETLKDTNILGNGSCWVELEKDIMSNENFNILYYSLQGTISKFFRDFATIQTIKLGYLTRLLLYSLHL